MKISYYEYWVFGEGRGINPLSIEEAEKFHQRQKHYVAEIINNKRYVVNVNFNFHGFFCSAKLLNQYGKNIVLAAYQIHEGNLFLRNVQMWKYDQNQEPIRWIGFVYEWDGRYKKVVIDEQYNEEVTYGKTNVDHHFRDMIQFGKYESILDGIEGFLDEA
ncbi:hypothetical protein JQC72_13755 [Polycladomyces sp. WAk]|uniref:YopX protein domain-containing protein n=1 Tax=Polycladomyces zharkentensis TaxID=2807616 RepID=A0ABS2WLY2_9BACL|nr:hypothetical protein [Polycladomyces sp. WAk]MBN2910567.1 hypothetical protein [Polycladomyces sp. WAk]